MRATTANPSPGNAALSPAESSPPETDEASPSFPALISHWCSIALSLCASAPPEIGHHVSSAGFSPECLVRSLGLPPMGSARPPLGQHAATAGRPRRSTRGGFAFLGEGASSSPASGSPRFTTSPSRGVTYASHCTTLPWWLLMNSNNLVPAATPLPAGAVDTTAPFWSPCLTQRGARTAG